MFELKQSMTKLLALCEIESSSVPINKSPKLVDFFEKICRDDSVIKYLDELNNHVLSAVKALEDKKLDVWCIEQDNLRLGKLEKEHQLLQKKYEEQLVINRNNTVDDNKNSLTVNDEMLKMIKGIIAMRDTLLNRMEWAQGSINENNEAVKIIKSQIKETGKLLQNSGVRILDDCSEFDSKICTVIDTIATNDISKIDTIAKIFRPGYEYMGEMLRSKEVILYIKE